MHKQATCSTPVKRYILVTIVDNNILNITHIPTKRTHDNMQKKASCNNLTYITYITIVKNNSYKHSQPIINPNNCKQMTVSRMQLY